MVNTKSALKRVSERQFNQIDRASKTRRKKKERKKNINQKDSILLHPKLSVFLFVLKVQDLCKKSNRLNS